MRPRQRSIAQQRAAPAAVSPRAPTCGARQAAHGGGQQREEGVELVCLVPAPRHPRKVDSVPDRHSQQGGRAAGGACTQAAAGWQWLSPCRHPAHLGSTFAWQPPHHLHPSLPWRRAGPAAWRSCPGRRTPNQTAPWWSARLPWMPAPAGSPCQPGRAWLRAVARGGAGKPVTSIASGRPALILSFPRCHSLIRSTHGLKIAKGSDGAVATVAPSWLEPAEPSQLAQPSTTIAGQWRTRLHTELLSPPATPSFPTSTTLPTEASSGLALTVELRFQQ